MIVYKNGDLLVSDYPIIINGCNCLGKFGTGLAKAIKDTYPEVYSEYSLLCDKHFLDQTDRDLLGQVQYVMTKDKTRLIVNAFTQFDYGKDGRYTSYDAVDKCFEKISKKIPENRKIGMGKIGCVSAGGNWNVVEQIINQWLPNHQIGVVTL